MFAINIFYQNNIYSFNWIELYRFQIHIKHDCNIQCSDFYSTKNNSNKGSAIDIQDNVKSSFCVVCPMFPVSLDCPFLISPSVFSNVYSDKHYLHIPEGVLLECNIPLYKDDNHVWRPRKKIVLASKCLFWNHNDLLRYSLVLTIKLVSRYCLNLGIFIKNLKHSIQLSLHLRS